MIKRLLAYALVLALTTVWHSEPLLAETLANPVATGVQTAEHPSLLEANVATGVNVVHSSISGCAQGSHSAASANCLMWALADEPSSGAVWRRNFSAYGTEGRRLRPETLSLSLRPPILPS